MKKIKKESLKNGFTLVEMLITITIIVTLLSIVVISIDPARRIHQARNAVRWSDVNSILNAVKKYQVEHEGAYPKVIEEMPFDQYVQIGKATGNLVCRGTETNPYLSSAQLCQTEFAIGETGQDCLNLENLRPQLPEVPQDPKSGNAEFTRYYAFKDSVGLMKIGACDPEAEGIGGGGKVRVIEVVN